nr:DUF4397 domain-containing protein [Sedimentibacter sp.]
MFFFPYPCFAASYMIPKQMNSYVRILHASPNAPAVDIYANGNLIVSNLAYSNFTQYLPVPTGNYNVRVYPTGNTTDALIDTNIYVPEDTVTNVAITGELPEVSLFQVSESIIPANYGEPCIRFIHLSPDTQSVDIKFEDDSIVFEDVAYKEVTNYVCALTGTYNFKVTPTGSNDVILTVPDVKLDPNYTYTIYAVGLTEGTPELKTLLAQEKRN